MFTQRALQLRPLAIIAAFGALALANSAQAATVSLTLASSLPNAGASMSTIDFSGAALGTLGTTGYTTNGNTASGAVTLTGTGSVVVGSLAQNYTAPAAAGTSKYLSTGGQPNSITLTFSTAQSFLGLDWGSIGTGDTLSFYNGSTQIGTSFTGAQLISLGAVANADAYTLFNVSGGQFTSVVLSQTGGPSFEASNFEYSTKNVPEPTSIALAGVALLGCVAVRRKA